MKKLVCIVLYVLSAAHAAAHCRTPDTESLRQTWKAFRTTALSDKPAQTERFYAFPLRLLTNYDNDKPAIISRMIFLKNYELLFVKNPAGQETGLHEALKKTTGDEYIRPPDVQPDHCKLMAPVRVADYLLGFDQKKGWLIQAVYYGSDFDLMKDAKLDKVAQ